MTETKPASETKALPLDEGEEPGPVEFVVEGLVLDKQLNSLFGDGGLGKSYLALHLAYCVASGRPFFGRAVSRRPVLYIDVENLGHEETKRRAFQIARGYEQDRPDRDVYYYAPEEPLGNCRTTVEIRSIIDNLGVGFIVLDSLTLGAVGTNASDQVEVVKLLKEIHSWAVPVLTLDHITKAARSDQSNAQAFGSVMKRNAARSMMRLHRDSGSGLLVLTHDKLNCGPLSAPVHYEMKFGENTGGRVVVAFEQAEAPATGSEEFLFDAPLEELKLKPPTQEDLVAWHVRLYDIARGAPVDAETIAEEVGIRQSVVSTLLAKLASEGRLVRERRGFYRPADRDLNQYIHGSNPYRKPE